MNFEKLYREIKTCPWCSHRPTLTVTPHPNNVTFNVRLGCRNIKSCLFNPYQELTCSIDELDSCVDEIIDNWNGRTESAVQPPQVNITVDTESKWVLSEPDKEEETDNIVVAFPCRDCKYLKYKYKYCDAPYSHIRTNNFCLLHHKPVHDICKESCDDFYAEHDYDVDDRKCVMCKHWYLDINNYAWCKRHAARTVDALEECRYKDFIDRTKEETNDTETEHKCADCESFDTKSNTCLLKEDSFPNGCDFFCRVCSDCEHYWYCAGEECCQLYELSFPKPCNNFKRLKEDS